MNLDIDKIWIGIGLIGQLMFSARFLVQWIASERAGRSLVPMMFWYFSIAGSLILLCYAISRHDPVFTLGQSFGLFVYLRNLYFLKREARTAS
ncbi:MAG: lipid A biosynthesis protein [Gammaproteobacteria bacterium]|nr:MAG: lipid A biosynthesis protein [Gammaproteobacteria bacterium]